MQWPATWAALDENDECTAVAKKVLLREVGPGHLLYGVPVQAIGRNFAADDVLYRLLDGSGRVADVHLTWTRGGPEQPPYPHTLLYDTVEAWLAAQPEWEWES